MTVEDLNNILGKLAQQPNRDTVLELALALVQWLGLSPATDPHSASHAVRPRLLSPKTMRLMEYLATAPMTVQPQLYRLTAEKQSILVRFAVLKKLKKDYISQLVDNDPGLGSYQAFTKNLVIPEGNAYVPSQPYFINFVTTPAYDRLVLIFNQGEQKRILTFRNKLSHTQHNKIIEQWFGIAAKPKREIADLLWRSIDIKEVNKEFYQLVKGQFDALVNIAGAQAPKVKDGDVKQFAVRLIGRYIFCWFLKEKEIIPGALISSGTVQRFRDSYCRLYLVKLFFQTLNAEVTDKARYETLTELDDLYKNIPYLNGGLFERHPEDVLFEQLDLNAWLVAFVKVLEKFDFTVDESSSRYQLVAIDPEMLGRIFENLLASQNEETEKLANQRKAFGAFYTPREIVDYMVNESLKAHLETHVLPPPPTGETAVMVEEPTVAYGGSLFQHSEPRQTVMNLSGKEKATLAENERKRERLKAKIEKLFSADNPDNPFDKDETIYVRNALSEVKVLDPACGSGAFPMGVMLRLMELRQIVGHGHKNNYELKNEILSRNIYGVDIMPMAVEIARLRAWLSLVLESDYKPADRKNNFGIAALPNLDFKFVCANSLIDSGYDEFLRKVNEGQTLTLMRLHGEIQKLENIRSQYFDPKGDKHKKEALQAQFNETKEYIKTEFASLKKTWKLDDFMAKVDDWNPFDDSRPSSFFSPAWMFGTTDGFDVVIGNPPYGVNIKKTDNPVLSEQYKEILKGEVESYILFYYRGLKVLSKNGFLSFITPDSWFTNKGAAPFRKYLTHNHSIKDVYDIYKPFEAAKDTRVHTVLISVAQRKEDITVKQVHPQNTEFVYRNYSIPANIIASFLDSEWRFYINKEEREIFNKMEYKSQPLEKLYNIKYGLRTGDNDKYVTGKETVYPLIAGADIATLYEIKWKPKYLKHKDGLPEGYFKEYFSYKKIIIQYVRTNSLSTNARWIEAAYLEGNYIPLNSLNYVYEKTADFSLMYLLGLLNSFLMNKYYRAYYTDVNVKPTYLAQLPIPNISSKQQQPFITLVDKILALKKQNLDTTALEKEIDVLVYKLYELNYEEVKIIDKDFWLSAEEYENYNA